jgi:hypothetical protein
MSTIQCGLEASEKAQLALDRLFGVTHNWRRENGAGLSRWLRADALSTAYPAFESLREAYVFFTGDAEVVGPTARRVEAELNSTVFNDALGVTLNKLLLQNYVEEDYGMDLLVPQSSRKSVPDFRTQERIRVGEFDDLPVNDPELVDWAELGNPTDEKASVAIVQFGGLISVTRKTIINDEIGFVKQTVSKAGRAARRTLAQRIVNLITANAAIYDGVAWAHATHGGNLRTTALSGTEIEAGAAVMYAQTEKDSAKKLGLEAAILMVPRALQAAANAANERPYLDAVFTNNPAKGRFGKDSERIITCPLFADTNDFAMFANPEISPCLEIDFLNGHQEPEILLADAETAHRVLTSDRIQYKVRHEYEVLVTDYRGYVRNVVV